jgi:hypothetical protein
MSATWLQNTGCVCPHELHFTVWIISHPSWNGNDMFVVDQVVHGKIPLLNWFVSLQAFAAASCPNRLSPIALVMNWVPPVVVVIVEVGKKVKKYKVGDRVFVSHHVPCDTCHFCLDDEKTLCHTLHTTNFYPGGFAEYLLVPEINIKNGVFILPNEVSYDEGVFIEPLACVVRGLKTAGMKPGLNVLVMGSRRTIR